jgi:membrane-bound lytic murein transglycosylase D
MSRFCVLPVFLSLFAAVSAASAANPQLSSEGLEQRVDFWKKVYTQYGEDDVIIHDLFHVNLIYDVATDADAKSRTTAVKATLREIREGLNTPETFSPEAAKIVESIAAQGIPLTAALMDDLLKNVHTQRGIKEQFREGVIRSGRHVLEFRETLKKAGVPEELALLPLVESSFQNVRSRAGAVGVWQFTRGTGRQYLKINTKVDERLDPSKAAHAAGRLLRDNYNALGNWPLAITAYNHGQAGMLRAKKAHGPELTTIIQDYRGPVFGYASMNFYSEFLAAVEVYDSYATYFGDLVLDTPSSPVKLAAAKPAPKAAPAAKAKTATASAKYQVKRGDTLWEVAQRFGTSIRSLMELNNLQESAIYAGQILLVK